jgi:hypothetical protein
METSSDCESRVNDLRDREMSQMESEESNSIQTIEQENIPALIKNEPEAIEEPIMNNTIAAESTTVTDVIEHLSKEQLMHELEIRQRKEETQKNMHLEEELTFKKQMLEEYKLKVKEIKAEIKAINKAKIHGSSKVKRHKSKGFQGKKLAELVNENINSNTPFKQGELIAKLIPLFDGTTVSLRCMVNTHLNKMVHAGTLIKVERGVYAVAN